MKKTFSILFLIISFYIFSQENISISGLITEKSTSSIIPYTNIIFTNKENQKLVFAVFSDEKGKFNVEIIPGNYLIDAEQVGFKKFHQEISLIKSQKINPIKLEISNDEKELDLVTINTSKPIYKVELDKKIYDVSQDLTAKGGNLADVMQNVPSVNVDSDGSLSIRGNTDVTVLIDGKPSSLLGINSVSDALKMIPSEMVAKIEVITNPSSRYESKGTGGIVNIVTKKDKKKGLNGSIELFTGIPETYGTNLRIGYTKKKLTIFGNTSIRYSQNKGLNTVKLSQFKNSILDKYTFQDGENIRNNRSLNIGGGINYAFDESNSIGFSTNFSRSYYKSNNQIIYNDYLGDLSLSEISERNEQGNGDNNGVDFNLDFTHKFKKEGEELNINSSYQISNSDGNSTINEFFTFPNNLFITKNQTGDYSNQNSFTLKTDYILPIKEGSKFETGFRIDTKSNDNQFFVSENNQNLDLFTNTTNYKEKIYGIYSQYGNTIDKFSYLLGLRLENSNIEVSSLKENTVTKNYTDLFPTIHLNYNITEKNQLQLSYSNRISRPFARFLTPYFGYTDSRNIFKGNPELNPSYTSTLELGYNIQKKKIGFTPSIYYQYTKDDLKMYVTKIGDLFFTQPNNIGSVSRYGLELSYNLNLVKWMKWFGEFNFFGYENKGNFENQNFDKNGFAWRARLNGNFKLPKKIDLQIQGNYRAPQNNAQSVVKPLFMMNLGLSKEILKGKGTLTFNVKDLLNSQKRNITTTGIDYIRELDMQWQVRQINLTFSYRFNNSQFNNKKERPKNTNGDDSSMEIY